MGEASESIVAETTRRIFSDLSDPQAINVADSDAWREPLWTALEENGLTLTWIPEDRGGVGGRLIDAFDVVRIAGQFAEPVALSETLLAGWLLARTGQEVKADGVLTVAPVRLSDRVTYDGTKLRGRTRAVPYARRSRHVIVFVERSDSAILAIVSPDDCRMSERSSDLGGERVDISFDNVAPLAVLAVPPWLTRNVFDWMGAAVRAVQMTGALESILAISTQYAHDRTQFGRPIAKFQAVQHRLAELGGEVAAALAASGSAAETIESDSNNHEAVFLEVASAKIRVGEAAKAGTAIAHQVHGAIGFTNEHVLQRFSRRLWGWRDDFGGEAEWAVALGNSVVEAGADKLWPTLTSR
ncbi:MAG: acyl-CoA dehydrogenase family protein [Hyphomicrobiaceae bacterium]